METLKHTAHYLIEGKDKYIRKYLDNDFVKILKDSAYYSEEQEETDSDIAVEDNEEAIQTKSTLLVIYKRWRRSPTVCIFIIY